MDEHLLVIIKLGGAALTDKRAYRHLKESNLATVAADISAVWRPLQHKPHRHLAIVHGAGSFGHQDVHAAHLIGAKLDARASAATSLGLARTRASLTLLHAAVLDALVREDISVATVASWPHGDGVAENTLATIERGLVPVLHGDVVIDAATGVLSVLSGDELVSRLADAWLATCTTASTSPALPPRVVIYFVTGAAGVFTAPPERAELSPRIIRSVLVPRRRGSDVDTPLQEPRWFDGDGRPIAGGEVNDVSGRTSVIDVSGGIVAKLGCAVDIVRRHSRATVAIIGEAALHDALDAAFNTENQADLVASFAPRRLEGPAAAVPGTLVIRDTCAQLEPLQVAWAGRPGLPLIARAE